MGCRQIFVTSGLAHPAISNAAPVGDVGVNVATAMPEETKRWRKVLLEIVVSGGASDVILWTKRSAGVQGDSSDDVWALFNDMFGVIKLGKIATALAVGKYHYIIPDVGGFGALYVQNSANTVTATILPIEET